MGVASYQKTTAHLKNQIADLNAARTGTVKLFRDTCIRIDRQGTFWVMDDPETGWSSYGRPYKNLRQIVAYYAIHLVGLSSDEHSTIIPVLAL